MRFFDTMSMHIACSGYTTDQRIQKLTNFNSSEIDVIQTFDK